MDTPDKRQPVPSIKVLVDKSNSLEKSLDKTLQTNITDLDSDEILNICKECKVIYHIIQTVISH